VSIHSSHPFLPPDDERDPVRRFRGRLGAAVSVWTTGEGTDAVGLTVSSMLVVAGEPGRVLGLVDPDSDLAAAIAANGRLAVSLLRWPHRGLADAFAGVAPAPGGAFRLGEWRPSEWGPVLADALAWAGCRLLTEPRELGWSLLVEAVVERVDLGDDSQPLLHRRGRYFTG